MKKVIFICLLSLSMCLSAPSAMQGEVSPHDAAAVNEKPTLPSPAPVDSKAPIPATPTDTHITTDNTSVPKKDTSSDKTSNQATPQEKPATDGSKPATDGSKPTTDGSKPSTDGSKPSTDGSKPTTDGSKPAPVDHKVEPSKEAGKDNTVPSSPTADKSNSTSKVNVKPADDKNKVQPSLPPAHKDVTVKPTEDATKAGEEVKPARSFDGASFIGGIILTLGLIAIGFMGLKYYKAQTERNYHTL